MCLHLVSLLPCSSVFYHQFFIVASLYFPHQFVTVPHCVHTCLWYLLVVSVQRDISICLSTSQTPVILPPILHLVFFSMSVLSTCVLLYCEIYCLGVFTKTHSNPVTNTGDVLLVSLVRKCTRAFATAKAKSFVRACSV